MDKIIALFEEFREHQLSFDQLYAALLEKVQQDASFRHQAIPSLDQVQKSTPIPITNFIELRSRLDDEIRNLPSAAPSNGNAQSPDHDSEATLITQLPGEVTHPNAKNLAEQPAAAENTKTNNVTPHDPTLIATSTSNSDNTSTSASSSAVDANTPLINDQQDEDDDEATVIMSANKLGSLRSITPPVAQYSSTDDDEEETLITSATSSSTTTEIDTGLETTAHDAATLVGAENTFGTASSAAITNNESYYEEPEPLSEPLSTPPQDEPKSAILPRKAMIASASGIGIVVILISFLWPTNEPSTIDSANTELKVEVPKEESWGSTPAILQPAQPSVTLTSQPSVPSTEQVFTQADNNVAGNNVKVPEPTIPAPESASEPTLAVIESAPALTHDDPVAVDPERTLAEPSIEKITFASATEEADYLFKQITIQEGSNNLGPAEKVGSATYYLVKLIKLKPGSPLISKARSSIAKAHLVLANTARENEDWDGAQQHLDDAFNVRLPDSYE